MPKFSANLTMLFNEVGFLDRFERAHKAGFKGVEYFFPYDWPPEVIIEKLNTCGLEQVLFNLPCGDWGAGERGTACLPGRENEFREGVGLAIDYAKALKCPRVNCLVGIRPEGVPADKVHSTLVDNLRFGAGEMEKAGVILMIEPLSTQEMPGFHLVHTRDALDIIREVGSTNLKLQYDIFHMQIMEGNLIKTIRDNLEHIEHMQLADNPGRHEPGTGEINYTNLLRFIDEAGYRGWMGCEYRPAGKTEEGLGWLAPYF